MKVFLSATGLVWCGFFSLIMIGVIYFLKKDKTKVADHLKKTFIFLYCITILSILAEFLLQNALAVSESHPIYSMLVSRFYIFWGMLWNAIVIIYYTMLYRKYKGKEFDYSFSRKLNTIIFGVTAVIATLVISLPLTSTMNDVGFYILDGPLNLVYNRMAIICDGILALFIIINNKKIPKQLVWYSVAIFVLYLTNFVLEGVFDYYMKDSQFIYSLFVTALYFTTESQDRQALEKYEELKNESIEVDKQKTKFLLNMSHEIRTPLNTILGYSDYLLLDEHFDQKKIEIEGENVYQASETLLSLINNILDISRIESGKETLVEGDYKLESVITSIYEKITPKAAIRNNVKFNLELDQNLPASYTGDVAKLERILISILNNAVEHTTIGEVKLTVSGERVGNDLNFVFHIKNAGHEMQENKFKMNFDEITSLDTTENIDNNILGIIIAKQLLELLNGTVEFINKPGQGTQYIVRLTQKCYGEEKVGNVIENLKKSNEEEMVNCEGKVVLVADDNAINLTIAKRLLVKFGFEVETCLSGQECLEMAKNKKYDMIYLDHMMPGMDGVETLNNLKQQHSELPPTIALTANASDDSRSEYIKLGFTDYLTKPIDMKELNKILKNLFKGKEN